MLRALVLSVALTAGAAYAGCGDALVLRVDTGTLQFQDSRAELHGAYAWEASPDSWATHPVGGSELGFVQLTCPSSDTACQAELKGFVMLAGSGRALQFTGQTFQKGVRPEFMALEGSAASTVAAPWPVIVSSSPNTALWNAVQAMPRSDGPTPRRGCSAAGGELAVVAALLVLKGRRRML